MRVLSSLTFAAMASLAAAPTLAVTKAALTESVLPSRPYNGSANGSAAYVTIGPGAGGTLGMTSLTLTNLGSANRAVFVFAPLFSDGQACGSSSVVGGSSPRFYVQVPAGQTIHLTYPSPVVYGGIAGQSCVAFGGAAGVDITVNGFVN